MAIIYSTFSNIQGDLPALQLEYNALRNLFDDDLKGRVNYKTALNASVEKITADLLKYQKDLKVFHFSGHSDKEGLDFGDADFKSGHVAKFFNP